MNIVRTAREFSKSSYVRFVVSSALVCVLVLFPRAASANVFTDVLNPIMQGILYLVSFLVAAGGVALNGAAYYGVYSMGAIVNQIPALQTAWSVFRDIGNIVLIFGFIAIGVSTILDIGGHETNKKLVTLLIVAVTINFSALAARTVVDVGNVTALQFYKAFNNGVNPGTSGVSDNGLSEKLMQALKLQSLYNDSNNQNVSSNDISTKYPIVAFLSIILFLVISVVFFAIAIMLVIRFVVLIFLITISPLAFVAMVLPRFSDQTRAWWSALLNQTFSAPAMLLLILISTNIVTGTAFQNLIVKSSSSGSSWASVGSPSTVTSLAGLLVLFMISCGFYLASLMVGKKMSAAGADFAISTSRATVGGVLGYSAAKFGGRTIQRRTANLAKRYETSAFAEKQGGGILDSAIKGGFGKVANTRIGGFASASEYDKAVAERKSEIKHAQASAQTMRDLEESIKRNDGTTAGILQKMSLHDIEESKYVKAGAEGIKTLAQNLTPEKFEKLMDSKNVDENIKHDMQHARYNHDVTPDAFSKLSTKDLELFAKADPDTFSDLVKSSKLSDDQIDTLSKSNSLTQDQRKIVKENSTASRVTAYANGGGGSNPISNLSPKLKAKLPKDTLTNPAIASTLDSKDLAAIMAEGNLQTADVQKITTALRSKTGLDRSDIDRYMKNNKIAAGYWQW